MRKTGSLLPEPKCPVASRVLHLAAIAHVAIKGFEAGNQVSNGIPPPVPSDRWDSVETRKSERYRLDLPVTYMWRRPQGSYEHGAGFAWDISVAGMFVVTSQLPPPATHVWCEVMLPQSHAQEAVRKLRAAGPVIRTLASGVEDHPGGFAIYGSPFLLTDEADQQDWMKFIDEQRKTCSLANQDAHKFSEAP